MGQVGHKRKDSEADERDYRGDLEYRDSDKVNKNKAGMLHES